MKGLIGKTLAGRYLVDCVLANGTAGPVFLARDVEQKRRFALKLFPVEAQRHPALAERFEREAVVGAKLDHPNVAGAFDSGALPDGSKFLVMEYVRGRTLRTVLDAEGPLGAVRAAALLRQLAVGLEHVHQRGVVHRHVEPSNVLVTDQDFVKLVDFGLAKVDAQRFHAHDSRAAAEGADLPRQPAGASFGSIAYLAPEVAFGIDFVDSRADLYALGVVAYEMLTGKLPFEAKSELELFRKQRHAPPPPFGQRVKGLDVDPMLEAVVLTLLVKEPDGRYRTAADLALALDAAIPTTPVQPTQSLLPQAFPPDLAARRRATPAPAAPRVAAEDAAERPVQKAAPDADVAKPLEHKASEPRSSLPRPRRGSRLGLLAAAALVALGGAAVARSRRAVSEERASGRDAPGPSAEARLTEPRLTEPRGSVEAPRAPGASAPLPLRAPGSASAADPASAGTAPAPAVASPEVATQRKELALALKLEQWDQAAKLAADLLAGDPAPFAAPGGTDLFLDVLVGLANVKHGKADEVWSAAASSAGGPDLLYRILEARGKGAAAERARALLRSPAVQKRMGTALTISFQLREGTCKDRVGLVERAVSEGDQRTAVALKSAVRECVASPEVVDRAIERLRERLAKPR